MKNKKPIVSFTESSRQKEWGPVRITLVAVAVALGIDFICFVLTARGDLFSTLFHGF